MASKLKPLMSHGKRPWSYLTSSLSSSKSLPLHPIPDPTGDPPAAQAGDTPPVEQPTPAPAGMLYAFSYCTTLIMHACVNYAHFLLMMSPNSVIIIGGVAVSDLENLPSPN